MHQHVASLEVAKTGFDDRVVGGVKTNIDCVKLPGQRLMARDFDRQVAEFQVRVAVLNGYAALGIRVTTVAG
jgi:hypothetical protein